jgi:hypothetical protein
MASRRTEFAQYARHCMRFYDRTTSKGLKLLLLSQAHQWARASMEEPEEHSAQSGARFVPSVPWRRGADDLIA